VSARRVVILGVAAVIGVTTAAIAAERAGTSTVVERYSSGRVKRLEERRDGKLDGVVREWYENGARMREFHYRRGVSEGSQRQWYPGGQLFTSFHHHDGQELGQQQMWNPDGTVRSNYVIRNGRRYGLLGSMGCSGSRDSTKVEAE
jgi:antitoxin component YwqK of YwqJK toxin-antitoxin module